MSIEELQSATESRYEIEGFLAEGGMGTVYTARHRSLGSRVAIKVLPADVASSAVRLARFKREAALSANLSHPNIVPVFEFDATEGLAYLVMPFVEGETLANRLVEKGRVDYPTVRRMLREVASALGFAHQREIVHRDVKPANILREEATGRWLITDFGIAHVAGPTDTEITQTGTIIGTPAYMAPEQRWGGKVDGRSDLYSLAAVVFQCICGTPTDYLADELSKGRAEIEKALRQAEPKIKPAVARALSWALEIKKEERPETAEAWLAALEEAEGTKSLFKWAGAAAIAALALIVVIVIRGEPEPSVVLEATTIAVTPFQGTVEGDAGDLPRDLAEAFALQLEWLPNVHVIGPTAVAKAIPGQEREFARDTLGASVVMVGQLEGTTEQFRLTVIAWDAIRRSNVAEMVDSGSVRDRRSMVEALSLEFAESLELASDVTGWGGALPDVWEALPPFNRGSRDLIEGRYREAVSRFDEVISLDSTYAPAHFKRMLALIFATRPSKYPEIIGTALDAATRYSDRLPPESQQLLTGYELLLQEGDVRGADSIAQELVNRNPDAEKLFLLGFVRFNFRALLGKTRSEALGEARHYFQRAKEYEPKFAMASWHLGLIATLQGDNDLAQGYVRELLAVDSVSFWAEQARLADSLLFENTIGNVVQSVNKLSLGALELWSQGLAQLNPPVGTEAVANEALSAWWRRADNTSDRTLAFRMRMAHFLATGQFESADEFMQVAGRQRVPEDELARWILLSAITPLHDLGDESRQIPAARRLESLAREDAEAAWLLARWYLDRSGSDAQRAIAWLSRLADDSLNPSPHARSLRTDIDAFQALATDTATALQLWEEATRYYSIDFIYGLTASLWPLRLRWAQVAAAYGQPETALDIIRTTFEQTAGVVDQVVWPMVLDLKDEIARASGDPAMAAEARQAIDRLVDLLEDANGPEGEAMRAAAVQKQNGR